MTERQEAGGAGGNAFIDLARGHARRRRAQWMADLGAWPFRMTWRACMHVLSLLYWWGRDMVVRELRLELDELRQSVIPTLRNELKAEQAQSETLATVILRDRMRVQVEQKESAERLVQ